MMGRIFDIKEFGVHDGDGLVTTIFLKGCPLRCIWCHNPEGQNYQKELMVRVNSCKKCGLCFKPCQHLECQPFKRCLHICPDNLVKIVGEDIDSKTLVARILKNKNIINGVTFSGGEPLNQAAFILEVIEGLKGLKINIETSGYCDREVFKKVVAKVDKVFFDIKLVDEEQHLKYTGVSNKLILENLNYLKTIKKDVVYRTPLIPNITDSKENIIAIKRLIGEDKLELLAYNNFANVKYKMLGREYQLGEDYD